MALGKRIEDRLRELKWERRQLLNEVPSLTPQSLSNLINRDSARSEWDEEIARALGVSVLWLVYGHDDKYAGHQKTSALVANERPPEEKPLIPELLAKLATLDESHPALPYIQWALRDVQVDSTKGSNRDITRRIQGDLDKLIGKNRKTEIAQK